jgi:hypothetical protein
LLLPPQAASVATPSTSAATVCAVLRGSGIE